MKTKRLMTAAFALSLATVGAQAQIGVLVDSVQTDAAEIGVFDPVTGKYFVTDDNNGLFTTVLAGNNKFSAINPFPFANPFTGGTGIAAVSSVAIDPLGRGFGVATLIPDLRTETGKLVAFDTATNAILGTYDTSFHPDNVVFSPDGTKILTANEGDWEADEDEDGSGYLGTNANDTPGSISIFDIGAGAPNFGTLAGTVYDFSAGNLGAGASLTGIRDFAPDTANGTNDPSEAPALGRIEPEYIAVSEDSTKAFVTLQNNNAVGVFDLVTNEWSDIQNLGTIEQLVDASDSDGGIFIDDLVKGLPMPDTIQSFTDGAGNTFYVTVNEGDAALSDESRVKSANLDPIYEAGLDTSDAGLGRLEISNVDGDSDGDGDIDEITMFGTRSMSVWAEDGTLVYDTGSMFEENLRDNFPDSWVESRSDAKGPEPEALALGEIDGDLYVFVGNERSSEIAVLKLLEDGDDTFDGTEPVLVDTLFAPGLTRPESLVFISAEDSPSGEWVLLATYEDDAGIASFSVPEPTSLALLALGGLLVGRRCRA
ncbi:MAG: choice-of-anchor I family protein [Phycisphaeraceae bacterium]